MKKITLNLSLVLILLAGIVFEQFTISYNVLATKDKDDDNDDNKKDNIDEFKSTDRFYIQSYDSISSDSYQDSFVSSIPSTFEITDILSVSFADIIDTQINTGLEKQKQNG